MNRTDGTRIAGDIGGTHARFAVVRNDGTLHDERTVAIREHASLAAAFSHYVASLDEPCPRDACLGVAAPVTDDEVRFTNSPWTFSIADTRRALGLARLRVLNDFEALAWALPALGAADLARIGGNAAQPATPRVVLGPGTGFGVGVLVPTARGEHVVSTQGGHASIGAADARELRVLGDLVARGLPPSRESLLSGRGIETLHAIACAEAGVAHAPLSAAEITTRALAGGDAPCREALALFCAFLGTAAGDAALDSGARGGVYIGGGIVPRFVEFLRASRFRERFDAHRPMEHWLRPIPVNVIMHPNPGLLGAARAPMTTDGD